LSREQNILRLFGRTFQELPFRPGLGARSCASRISTWRHLLGVDCTPII
jgi:hypothetical protein